MSTRHAVEQALKSFKVRTASTLPRSADRDFSRAAEKHPPVRAACDRETHGGTLRPGNGHVSPVTQRIWPTLRSLASGRAGHTPCSIFARALLRLTRDITGETEMPVLESSIADWLTLVQAEYREIPGLRLTKPQVQRLWNLDA